MKKKLIALLTVFIMTATVFSGCSARFSKIEIREDFVQTYDYVVRSNGGSAVQYGDYIYFINGTRGYDNTDGKQNNWNNDTEKGFKGGLYKAKLLGSSNGREFDIERSEETGLQFVSHKGIKYVDEVNEDLQDSEKEEIDIVDVQLIAPKVIGTSGYSKGGIFIYDDFVYYASPNNTLNKQGVTQVDKTDFFRTKLDGSLTQLIFTTEGTASDKPYNFYKQGEYVYLVCYYDTSIVSVAMKQGSNKIENPMLLTDSATSVLLAHRVVYDSENNITNDPEDFVFFTRAITSDDLTRSGNVVEACRPDGSESFTVLSIGTTVTLEGLNGGGLFYRTTELGNDVLKFDNLHEKLMEFSPTYKEYEQKKSNDSVVAGERKRSQISETVFTGLSSYTSFYCFKDNLYANQCYAIAVTSNAVFLLSNYSGNIRILPTTANILFIKDNMLYYTSTDNNTVYRTNYTLSVAQKTESDYEQMTPVEPTSATLTPDYVAGNIFYFAQVDEYDNRAYGYFVEAHRPGAEAKEVYQRAEADEKPEDDESDNTETEETETE